MNINKKLNRSKKKHIERKEKKKFAQGWPQEGQFCLGALAFSPWPSLRLERCTRSCSQGPDGEEAWESLVGRRGVGWNVIVDLPWVCFGTWLLLVILRLEIAGGGSGSRERCQTILWQGPGPKVPWVKVSWLAGDRGASCLRRIPLLLPL